MKKYILHAHTKCVNHAPIFEKRNDIMYLSGGDAPFGLVSTAYSMYAANVAALLA